MHRFRAFSLRRCRDARCINGHCNSLKPCPHGTEKVIIRGAFTGAGALAVTIAEIFGGEPPPRAGGIGHENVLRVPLSALRPV